MLWHSSDVDGRWFFEQCLLQVLYDRAREGSRLLEQFKSNELDMAQMESEENERFISFLVSGARIDWPA